MVYFKLSLIWVNIYLYSFCASQRMHGTTKYVKVVDIFKMKIEWDKSLLSADFDVLDSISTKTGIRNSHGVFHYKCMIVSRN